MPSLHIRELPQDVYEALAELARREGRSVAQQAVAELRRVAELAAADRRLLLEELDHAVDERRQALLDPVRLIRENRDA